MITSKSKKIEISFRHYGGSGPLSIYWHDGPYGDAKEAQEGNGVYWSSPMGELLGVEFDDVNFGNDKQTLTLEGKIRVSTEVKKGKVINLHLEVLNRRSRRRR